jgi:hypothetical protein
MGKHTEDLVVESTAQIELDPIFKNQIDRLHGLTVYGRWLAIALLWLTVGAYSLWELRYPISLMQEDFTWAAMRYGLYFQPLPAFGLCLCVSMTLSTLVWHTRNRIWGLPPHEHRYLVKKVCHIRQQGSSHPLWKWVVNYS